jgi:hypothetical protein
MEISDIENGIKHNPVLCLYYVLKTKTYLPDQCKNLMPLLGTYLLEEIKAIEDSDKAHTIDIKLNKLGNEASAEYHELYKKSGGDVPEDERNLMYAQSLLAQCVSTAFALAWQATAMLSGSDYGNMILQNATNFISTAASSDSFKEPTVLTDFEKVWSEISMELSHIPEFPCSKSQILEILSHTEDKDKKRVLSFLIQ